MTQFNSAYLTSPSIHGDTIAFVSDDDIWRTTRYGGNAIRLTNSHGISRSPLFAPNGENLAYLTNDQGQEDIYLIPPFGGQPLRLTFVGVQRICCWKDNKTLIFASNNDTFSPRVTFLYELNIKTLEKKPLQLGQALSFVTDGKTRVLGRNTGDPARWKRYRGGTAGTLWVDTEGEDNFKQLMPKLKSNLTNPLLIDGKIFFISDHEGIGNIYSCNFKGANVKRITNEKTYYVRSFSYDQGIILYQSAASLYQLELKTNTVVRVDIHVPSSFNQSVSRIESADDFLQEYNVDEKAKHISIISRGQLFYRTPWSGAPIRLGDEACRYRLPLFITDPKTKKTSLLAFEVDPNNEESLCSFPLELNSIKKKIAPKQDWGKVQEVTLCPEAKFVAIANNRNQLFVLNLVNKKVEEVTRNDFHFYHNLSWSPCGRYLAYSEPITRTHISLFLYDTKKKQSRPIVESVLADSHPSFDPSGSYLYFIGMREFHPNYSETHFELSFPFATQVYAISLQKDLPSPLERFLDFDVEEEDDEDEKELKKKSTKKVAKKVSKKVASQSAMKKAAANKPVKEEENEETQIDWDGISQRIITLPLELGGYQGLHACEDKLFFLRYGISGHSPFGNYPSPENNLYTYCLKEKKLQTFQKSCHSFEVSHDGSKIILDTDEGLRLVNVEAKPSDGADNNKKDGYLDLNNFPLTINPKKEWRQMYREAWILQREHFWVDDMNKIDWQSIYKNYLPLLDKVHTRREFSDLMWEMQGELGTSHCYEFGGDYFRTPFRNINGELAANFKWDKNQKTYKVSNIAKGDSWIPKASSPLRAPGVCLEDGDSILGLDGRGFQVSTDLEVALQGRVNQKMALTVKRKGSSKEEVVEVSPQASSHFSRYRDWVNKNKEYVHAKSKGKVGYLHIPDMGLMGFSEFYRNFLTEVEKEGLIVDVRYNGGGHVSQHILKILAQKVIGFDKTRYMGIEPYPAYAINGPIVALTNEHAGSDGDIFSHSFKLMGLGPLIGKRTWGGVVGIWPRHPLNDGTITSQPEFSFWFKDVGYDVENYGTDPDIEVDILPKDWKNGVDPQLDRSIAEALKLKKKQPTLKPNLNKNRPNLRAPKLPN